jgi:hypothetical protein
MKEEILIELGFEKNEVSEEESGNYPFYYYTMEFGDLTLISNADDEATKGSWLVEIFDYQTIQINDEQDLKNLIDIFKRSIK